MRLGYHVTPHNVLVFDRPIEGMSLEVKNGTAIRVLVVTSEGVVAVPMPLPQTTLRPRLLSWASPTEEEQT